ncbi:MAG TPA: DUF2851 family protein, partial [Saprospiraceae bacterium]|nr:DUF2851 family protein [Saprospiraceae bacterium]
CIELQHLTPPALLQRYRHLMEKNRSLACSPFLEHVPESLKAIQLERMMIERLQEKTERVKRELSGLQWDWDALVYRSLAHYLGAPVNSAAMDLLVEKIPLKLIMKVHHDPILLDALILGMSGLIPSDAFDDYTSLLQSNFRQLALKFKLEAMESFHWKWLRLRPPHFPDLRLAQLSAILQPNPRLWSRILEAGQLKDIHALLRGRTHPYWDHHFRFSVRSKNKSAEPGVHMREILIINVICPILFAYGSVYQQAGCRQKAIELLEKIKPEPNFITSTWKKYNFALIHAGHSQGGIQLYRHYCTEKKCTSCLIGHEILRHPI